MEYFHLVVVVSPVHAIQSWQKLSLKSWYARLEVDSTASPAESDVESFSQSVSQDARFPFI